VFATAGLKSVGTLVVPVNSREGHQLVVVQFPELKRVELPSLKRVRLDAVRLMQPDVLERYQAEVEHRFGTLDLISLGDFTSEIVKVANDTVGLRQSKKSGDSSLPLWWTDELTQLTTRKKQLLNMASLTKALDEELRDISTRMSHLMRTRTREHYHRLDAELSDSIRTHKGLTRDTARTFRSLLTSQRAAPTVQPTPDDNLKFWSDIFAPKDQPGEKEQLANWCADPANFPVPTDPLVVELLAPFTA
jgi:hypothetical protein